MKKHRTPVDTSAFFTEVPGVGPVAVLGAEDLWGPGLEAPRLQAALEVVRKLIYAAMVDRAFTRGHLEALEEVEGILQDLLSDTPPPQWWEREWGLTDLE